MEYFFSPHEIAEMAMRVEDAGIGFYKKAAELATDEAVKKIFLFLSDAEIDHKNTFKAIMEAEQEKSSTDEYAIDIASNIGRLIEKSEKAAFNLKSAEASSLTVARCLDVGIHVESGLIAVYSELYETFIDKFHGVLEKIVDQEKIHLEMLQNVKKQLGL